MIAYINIIHVSITYVCTVDKWRVVLKRETPDYINASSINVSSSTNTLSNISHKLLSFPLTDRVTSAKELL